jgi:hypothetical protein
MSIIRWVLLWCVGRGCCEAPLAFATCELGGEGVKTLRPEVAKVVQPHVDLVERCRVDGVEPPRPLGPDRREAAVPEDLEVLRDRRLRDPELGLDDRGESSRGHLAFGEQLEDSPSDRIAEDVERVHERILKVQLI